MKDINENKVRERVVLIMDMAHANIPESVNDYIRDLRKAGGILSETAGNFNAFAKDFGSGI